MPNFHIFGIENRIAPLREALLSHAIYRHLNSELAIRIFMEFHVFAVWDFMSILKTLQGQLTCTEAAWVPTPYPLARRLINEIVAGEESDLDLNGQPASHYEMYIQAMKESGANPYAAQRLIHKLREGFKVKEILRFNSAEIHPVALKFLKANQDIISKAPPHVVAAAFTFGREGLIPDLFTCLVKDLNKTSGHFTAYEYYLQRHIELDGDEHGPMSMRMMADLCGHDEQKWMEAEYAAVKALEARLAFWDGISEIVVSRVEHAHSDLELV
jgi:hypothetical protein